MAGASICASLVPLRTRQLIRLTNATHQWKELRITMGSWHRDFHQSSSPASRANKQKRQARPFGSHRYLQRRSSSVIAATSASTEISSKTFRTSPLPLALPLRARISLLPSTSTFSPTHRYSGSSLQRQFSTALRLFCPGDHGSKSSSQAVKTPSQAQAQAASMGSSKLIPTSSVPSLPSDVPTRDNVRLSVP
jgi:hypothetical protein